MGAKQELAQRKRELSVMQQELTVKISENGSSTHAASHAMHASLAHTLTRPLGI